MRLFTHNLLICNVKVGIPACVETAQITTEGAKNYPLKIEVAENGMKQEKSEFDAEMIVRLLPKLDWKALKQTALDLEIAELPDTVPSKPDEDVEFLQAVHDLVMDIHIMEGNLVCPHCNRSYPISKGIPNMLLNDDEL